MKALVALLLLAPAGALAASDAPTAPPALSGTIAKPGADDSVELAGDLRPIQLAELSFKVGGQLASFKAMRGDRVKKGQLLGQLSDAEARAQLAQAEAGVKAATAQLAMAEDAAKRVGELAENNAAPGMQKVSSTLQAEAARAGLAAANAQAELARANVDNHVLRAPFDGTLARVPDGVGNNVGPGATIARLERLDVLVLQASAGERELDRLRVGADVVVVTPSGREVAGHIRAIVRSLDAVSRRAPVEIEVPNADGSLIAGSYVRAHLRAPVASSR